MDKRIEFTVKRMVKAKNRLDALDKIYDDLQNFKREQSNLNRKFIDYMTKKSL
jgi:hypothetical protein